MDVPTIQISLSTRAQQARQLFTYRIDRDGEGYYDFDFDRYGWGGIRESPWYTPLNRVLAQFVGSWDFVCAEVVSALDALSDWSDEADPQDCIDQGVATDDLTGDLQHWFGLSLHHVEYLGRAAAERNDSADGHQLLAAAQEMAKREIWHRVVRALACNAGGQE